MRIKLFKIISVIGCLILLLSVAGCDTKKYDYVKKYYDRQEVYTLTICDSNNTALYYNYAGEKIEILSLDEEYYITVEPGVSSVNGAIHMVDCPYDSVRINYDKDCMEILPLPDYEGGLYTLRGLKECSNCLIEFYFPICYFDGNGNPVMEIIAYGGIIVNFSDFDDSDNISS